MAFPTVATITNSDFNASDATSHAVQMPATIATGDLLLTFMAMDTPSSTTTPAGWTLLVYYGISDVTVGIYAKVAIGNEDGTTVDWVTGDAQKGTFQVYQITGWAGALTGLAACIMRNLNNTTNRTTLSVPWGASDNLWIIGQAGSTNNPSGWGAGMDANYTNENISGELTALTVAGMATGRRQLAAAYTDAGQWIGSVTLYLGFMACVSP